MANVYKAVVGPGGPVPEGTVVAVKVLRQGHTVHIFQDVCFQSPAVDGQRYL